MDFNKPYSEPLEYHNKIKNERILHPETKKLVEYFLSAIDKEGINYFCKTVKNIKDLAVIYSS